MPPALTIDKLQIHFINNTCRFCGHFYPSRNKAALNSVSNRPDIRPCRTIKRHFIPIYNFFCKCRCQCGGNSLSPVFWQNIHTNLPHIFAVCGTGSQTNQGISVICADPQNVQMLALFAKRIAPFRQIQLPQNLPVLICVSDMRKEEPSSF